MHYAVHGRTAAELIVERGDAEQETMGLTSWENAPNGKVVKTDVVIAKNYLEITKPQLVKVRTFFVFFEIKKEGISIWTHPLLVIFDKRLFIYITSPLRNPHQ